MNNGFFASAAAFCLLATASRAAELPKGVKAPPGFDVTLFAAPPNVGYPTCLAAAPTGEIYVGIDENGSLDAKPKRGRVVRCIDRDGDGVADEFKTFAEMDSPRGLWFDNNVLYVQHPPLIEAFFDDNGDGAADRSEVLVRGLGFDLKFRGADHTINGMQMAIDGFLYIACGDYGGTNAVGRDGTRVQLHGGGVVRVRPDGSGLEIVSRGQRNIYDVAISPEMDLFTRDNTNDGGGWDVRLSHVVMFGNYGYPTLFKNSPPEIIQPLADYGGGSPCGSLFLDEPGYPEGFGTALYTCEWGRSKIFRHPLERQGASYKDKLAQITFMDLPRATDMDVDGSGRLYLASWAGGGFNYSGPNVGYVLRAVPHGHVAAPFPDLHAAPDSQLVELLKSKSAVGRLHTQREILRRGFKAETVQMLELLAGSNAALPSRIAAVFTLEQLAGAKAFTALEKVAAHDDLREAVMRAVGNNKANAAAAPRELLVRGLADANARVRLQAATAIGRLNLKAEAASLLPLVADSDPIVSHVAINVMAALDASDVCLKALDSPGTASLVPGAIRVLSQLHEPAVADGLLTRLSAANDKETRRALLHGLARLYNREADWDGRWWGTRPDTTGPYFKPVTWQASEKIASALAKELASANAEEVRWLAIELQKNRVDLPELTGIVLKLAAADPAFNSVAVDLFSSRSSLSEEAIPLFASTVQSAKAEPVTRVKALRALIRASRMPAAFDAALKSVVALTEQRAGGDLNGAWEEFARDTRHGQRIETFTRLARTGTEAERTVSFAVLTTVASQRFTTRATRATADQAIEEAWSKPEQAVPLLHALARLHNDAYSLQVRSLVNDSRKEVAAAARQAAGESRPRKESGPLIETLKFDDVVAAAQREKGDVRLGRELFARQGCVACHTTSADEPPKGPFLGGIGTRYSKAELCESILKPSAKIAQGFETQWFKTGEDEEVEGFVTREGGDDLDMRNIAGITTTLPKKQIVARGKRDKSMMPEGLANNLTPGELASLLAYLDSLKSK